MAPAGPQCSSRELSLGNMEWTGTKESLCVVYWIFWGFFPTTASVTVTPKWLHSSSKCRDERQTLKWPGTPCSQQKQLSCKPVLCSGFLGVKKEAEKKYMMCHWCLNGEKIYFQLQSGRNLVQSILGHSLPPLSLLVSLQIFLVQVFSQAALNCACLQFVFLQKDVFANFKPDLQSLKAEVASDAHRFCWILFFSPLACLLPKMSGNPSRDEHCNSNFWRAFFCPCFYTCFLSLVVAESLQVFIAASAIRFLCSLCTMLGNSGRV